MIEEQRQGLIKRQGLTAADLVEIEHLAHICNTCEGLDIKLNWSMLRSRSSAEMNDLFYYQQGRLVGYLAIYVFNSHEAEISGMVHPDYRRQGIFSMLLRQASEECRWRGVKKFFLIVEQNARSGLAFVTALSAHYHHSEYRMVLSELRTSTSFAPNLEFRPARPDERAILAHITATAFEIDEDVASYDFGDSSRRSYVALLNDVYIGKIEVWFDEQEAFIYGFGVLPEYQHKGYGRQMLVRAVQEVYAMGLRDVALEVEVKNESALALYHSCGFHEISRYDYYSYMI
jgi:ribosomal protein S18 acetylase RimI-like enzyme